MLKRNKQTNDILEFDMELLLRILKVTNLKVSLKRIKITTMLKESVLLLKRKIILIKP